MGNATLLEIVWTVAALVGSLFSVRSLVRAQTDERMARHMRNGIPLKLLARGHIRSELLRLTTQLLSLIHI